MALFKKGQESQEPKKYITVTTSDLKCNYQIIDAIFAIDADEEGFLRGANPTDAFYGVKEQLREQCRAYGGDAVICCKFDYRIALGDSALWGKKRVIEIWAYGTAVKFVQ